MTGLAQLTIAHAKQFFRVRQEVYLAFALPIFFMLVLGIVLSNLPDIGSVTNEGLGLTVGVVAAEEAPDARHVVEALERIPTFRVVRVGPHDGRDRLDTGALAALITVAPDGAPDGAVRVQYNTTRTQRSRVVLNRLHEMAAALNAESLGRALPVTLRIEGVGGEDDYSTYIDFFVPGVMAMAVFPGVVFSLTPTIVSHRERGVLRRLWPTPASMTGYLSSHVAFRLALALAQAAVILLTAAVVFRRPFHYGLFRLGAFCLAGASAGCGFAFLLAAVARTQAAAVTLAQITMIPMLLACGAFFPLELMPAAAMPVIAALPLTPLAAGLRAVLNFDHALGPLVPHLLQLGGYAVVAGALGVRLFRWDAP